MSKSSVVKITPYESSVELLHRHLSRNLRMRFISDKLYIVIFEAEQTFQSLQSLFVVLNLKPRQRKRLTRQHLVNLFEMVLINMVITQSVYKLANLQPAHVRNQM